MTKVTKKKAERIYKEIAMKHGVTVEEVKREIEFAMLMGMKDQSPEVQAKWQELKHGDEMPSIEDLLTFLSNQVR